MDDVLNRTHRFCFPDNNILKTYHRHLIGRFTLEGTTPAHFLKSSEMFNLKRKKKKGRVLR